MSEQGMLEQSALEAIISAIESYEKNDLDGWELYLVKRRAELADKEIAELKAQVALDESLMAESTRTIQELEAHINDLREHLKDITTADEMGVCDSGYTAIYIARKALAKTPAQSLQAHDDEVIERCAKICESLKEQDYCVDVRAGAEAIRALKG